MSEINLRDQGLESIPVLEVEDNDTVISLNLNDNAIESLEQSLVKLPASLTQLTMRHNKLSVLDLSPLQHCIRLSIL